MNAATGIVFDRSMFFRTLATTPAHALLINYDGVLAPLSVARERSYPYPTVPELLDSILTTCGTHLILITAMPALELRRILGMSPGPEIWGSRAFERLLPDGTHLVDGLDSRHADAIEEAYQWLGAEGLAKIVQRTYSGLLVCWDDLPEAEACEAAAAATRTLWPFDGHAEMLLRQFRGGLELCCVSRVADAVHAYLAGLGDEIVPAYLGNCTTEEGAFRAIANHGLGVLVCETFRATAAQLWLKPPEDVTIFLSEWIAACRGVM